MKQLHIPHQMNAEYTLVSRFILPALQVGFVSADSEKF